MWRVIERERAIKSVQSIPPKRWTVEVSFGKCTKHFRITCCSNESLTHGSTPSPSSKTTYFKHWTRPSQRNLYTHSHTHTHGALANDCVCVCCQSIRLLSNVHRVRAKPTTPNQIRFSPSHAYLYKATTHWHTWRTILETRNHRTHLYACVCECACGYIAIIHVCVFREPRFRSTGADTQNIQY